MPDQANFYIIQRKALPEVFLKVVQAKKYLEKEKAMTVQEAVEAVGISRSSFYKYKDTIFPFYENSRGRAITLGMRIDDEPGLLSLLLNCIAKYQANILTIHQTIPINGVADITFSIEVLPTTGDVQDMVNHLIETEGVHQVKILARE
ncbi:ACT domain-containing protein [Petrocella sp. FN5]|uniref:ACT domain-containing protein n=1 Tax=Petrocella sp. FN5 TaxID=3032002 RepID=UPI0023DC243A|nr:ACT domain-containing protein [Petrocella sp. FN5]MDF1615973.1 ACT domain-containing protein [Petrocella sp. FN5]